VTEPLPAIRIVSSNAKAKGPNNKVQRYRYAGSDEFSEAVRPVSLCWLCGVRARVQAGFRARGV
jgi:hypothetical protein